MNNLAILIPTYKRFDDLLYTLRNTPIDDRAKFIIVANLEDMELAYLKDNFASKAIIIDERKYGKLGGAKAYNLAYAIAKENAFDYAMLYADDIVPFDSGWLDLTYKYFIEPKNKFGIFSSDECHVSHYGWNIILDCPIAHFFIIDCSVLDTLFLDDYMQYAIDFEISARISRKNINIILLPVRLNHLRSSLHREFMEQTLNNDISTLTMHYPKYEFSLKNGENHFYLKETSEPIFLKDVKFSDLPEWHTLNSNSLTIFQRLKVSAKELAKTLLRPLANFDHGK